MKLTSSLPVELTRIRAAPVPAMDHTSVAPHWSRTTREVGMPIHDTRLTMTIDDGRELFVGVDKDGNATGLLT